MTRRGIYGCAFPLFNDMIAPYLVASATAEQQERWFPGLCAGTTIAAIAMTEPGAGSDLQGIRTRAVDAGDHYVLTGQKTFISNGILADLVVVVARTDPDAGHQGISLLVVERGMEGFERGRNLDKIGQHAQDTAELFFDHVRVPKANLLGEEGSGFVQLMTNLAQERLSIAVSRRHRLRVAGRDVAAPTPRTARRSAGPIGKFQHTRFMIAEMATEAHIARVFIDDCLARHVARRARRQDRVDGEVVDHRAPEQDRRPRRPAARRLRLHGRVPVARAFVNSRVQTIYGGTTEIQKEIIGRSLGL